jgi:proteasome lid subunit RPN8/RPN11
MSEDGTPTRPRTGSGSRSSRGLVPRGEGYELAVFHSHPSSPPKPSRADLERAGLWASRPWLILRTDTRELAAWRLDNGSATPIPLA